MPNNITSAATVTEPVVGLSAIATGAGVCLETVRRAVRDGRLPAIRVNRRKIVVAKSEADKFTEARRISPAEPAVA